MLTISPELTDLISQEVMKVTTDLETSARRVMMCRERGEDPSQESFQVFSVERYIILLRKKYFIMPDLPWCEVGY